MSPEQTPPQSRRPAWPLFVLAALAVLAIVTAALLTQTHAQIAAQPDFESFCDINQTVSCGHALSSQYATLLGVPVSVFAILAYALLLAFSILELRNVQGEKGGTGWSHRIFALSAFNLAVSLFMASVSAFDLQILCPLCAGLYVIALIAFAIAWVNLPEGIGGLGRGLAREFDALFSNVRNLAVEGSVFVAALALIIVFNTTDLMKAEAPVGERTPVTTTPAAPGEDLSPEEKRAQLKGRLAEYFDSLPAVDANTGHYAPKGTSGAPVTVIEFADFQCPACKRAWVVFDDLVKEHPDEVAVYFRHFPLSNECNPIMNSDLHGQACEAARAAHCAAQQDAFWKMADHLFVYQPRLAADAYDDWAKELGLDVSAFEKCFASDDALDAIKEDVTAGMAVEVHSTPTIIINGKKFEGLPKPDFLDLLVEVLSERKQ